MGVPYIAIKIGQALALPIKGALYEPPANH
jgi:hypothetical protein